MRKSSNYLFWCVVFLLLIKQIVPAVQKFEFLCLKDDKDGYRSPERTSLLLRTEEQRELTVLDAL